jgi:LEA14-like dessication related protein
MINKLVLVTLGVLFLLSSCRSLKEPDYLGIESFRLAKLGFPDSKLLVRLAYYNPNHFGVTVKQTECKVYVDSIFLGTFSLDSVIHVHDRENFYLPFTGQVTTTSLLQNGITAVSGKEMNIRIEGTTRVGKAGIFANYPIHYEGKQVLNTY